MGYKAKKTGKKPSAVFNDVKKASNGGKWPLKRFESADNGGAAEKGMHRSVPNVGGLIGATLKFSNAKIILGYRGDFIFDSMDTDVDERKTKTVGFYDPFATTGIGFGG